MARIYKNRHFGPETVQADGCEFIDCTFEGTRLVYRGGDPFILTGSGPTEIEFEGPAANTLNQLRAFHRFGLTGWVEQIIASIRNPFGDSSH